jgi:hypothetical protein
MHCMRREGCSTVDVRGWCATVTLAWYSTDTCDGSDTATVDGRYLHTIRQYALRVKGRQRTQRYIEVRLRRNKQPWTLAQRSVATKATTAIKRACESAKARATTTTEGEPLPPSIHIVCFSDTSHRDVKHTRFSDAAISSDTTRAVRCDTSTAVHDHVTI